MDSASSMIAMFAVPEGFRPIDQAVRFVCNGSSTAKWVLVVYPVIEGHEMSGMASLQRYDGGTVPKGAWLPVSGTWFTGDPMPS